MGSLGVGVPIVIVGNRVYAGPPAEFDPTYYGEVGLWLDPRRESFGYGEEVISATDWGPLGNNPNQFDSSKRPVFYPDGLNGEGVYAFNATTQSFDCSIPGMTGRHPYVVILFKSDTTSFQSSSALFEHRNDSSRLDSYFDANTSSFSLPQTDLTVNSSSLADGLVLQNADSWNIISYQSRNAATGDDFSIGKWEDSFPLGGRIAELVVYKNPPSNIVDIHVALAVKHGMII